MKHQSKGTVLVTGSAGLIGSEVVRHFYEAGFVVCGIDNNQRKSFFGNDADTAPTLEDLRNTLAEYRHENIDIRDTKSIREIVGEFKPNLIVHCAAQPSHDLATSIPLIDFEINTLATVNLLEAVRTLSPESVFVFMSTNKVYGDAPNSIKLIEREYRWEYADERYFHGIPETFSIDQSMHSLFGASKLSADIYVQEYGQYFGLKTCCLRGGCLTGPGHRAVKLHGFLSYLVRSAVRNEPYTILGYKGKQVRDNISSSDVVRFIHYFYNAPRCGEVYNIGGGRENSCSILEAIRMIEVLLSRRVEFEYSNEARAGDHICYISDTRKAMSHYPEWRVETTLPHIIADLVKYWDSHTN